MKIMNRKILATISVSSMMLIMSGCGSSDFNGNLDNNNSLPTPEPDQPITLQQAKDAMALNAIAYRIITPLYGTVSGLMGDATSSVAVNTLYGECDEGTFVRTETDNGLVFEFNQCKTTQPNADFQDPMIEECIAIGASIFPGLSPLSTNTSNNVASYYAIMNGKVTCESPSDTAAYAELNNYEVTAYNSTLQIPDGDNKWVYNMRIDISYELHDDLAGSIPNALYVLKVDGDFRGQKWDGSSDGSGTLINDETWTFDNLTVEGDHQGVDKPDILRASGSATYLGTVREGDTENNGMELSVGFDQYAYQFDPTDDIRIENIKISGKVQASCHPDWITYTTPETLIDQGGLLTGLKDAEGDRMPYIGMMTIATESTTGEAEAVFDDNGTNAQVTITAEDGSDTYESWRSIIEGSSCQVFQEIIDRIELPTIAG